MKALLLLSIFFVSAPVALSQSTILAPFPVNAKKLPARFEGNSVVALYDAVLEKTPSKSRYETQTAYEQRLLRIQKQPLFGSVKMSSPLAIVLAPSWCDYDTESGTSTAHFGLRRGGSESDDGTLRTLLVRGTQFSYGLKVMNASTFKPIGDNTFTVNFVKRVSPLQAERYEKNLRVAYVGYLDTTPRSSVLGMVTVNGEPEMRAELFINMRVKKMVFFDIATGVIYGQKTFTS